MAILHIILLDDLMFSNETSLFLYRTLDWDGDGDPLDHGVVRAEDLPHAVRIITAWLREVCEGDEVGVKVRVYPLADDGRTGPLPLADDWWEYTMPEFVRW